MKTIIALVAFSMVGLSSASSFDAFKCEHCKCGGTDEAGGKCDTEKDKKPVKKSGGCCPA